MRLVLAFAVLVALAAGPSAFAQTIGGGAVTVGIVTQTKGNVGMRSVQGSTQPLKKGQLIQPGVLIQSGRDSNTAVGFPDGQVGILGQNTSFRLNDYAYDPKSPTSNDFSVSLIEGALRVSMGEIARENPGGLKLQVGTATVSLQSTGDAKPADASLVTQQGAIAISVESGRLSVRLPSGPVQTVNEGQTLFVSPTGAISLGQTSKMFDALSQSPVGREIAAQLVEVSGFTSLIAESRGELSKFNAALKTAPSAVALATNDPATAELLKQLESLPATAAIDAPTLPQPSANSSGTTPATAGAGGGTPCAASCN